MGLGIPPSRRLRNAPPIPPMAPVARMRMRWVAGRSRTFARSKQISDHSCGVGSASRASRTPPPQRRRSPYQGYALPRRPSNLAWRRDQLSGSYLSGQSIGRGTQRLSQAITRARVGGRKSMGGRLYCVDAIAATTGLLQLRRVADGSFSHFSAWCEPR